MAMKQTKGIKRSETNQTADTSRKANIARVTAEATRKKAAKKPTAMKVSAASSQAGYAKISGQVAAKNKATAMQKAKQKLGVLDATGAAMTKAQKRTLKSFK